MEGACPLEMVHKINPDRFSGPPPMWDDAFRFPSFDAFMELYNEFCGDVFNSVDAYAECAAKVLADCAAQNVRYIETSFHIGALTLEHMDGAAVVAAIKDAAPSGVEVRVFMGMRHNDYVDRGKELIDDSMDWDGLAGIDLHGPEYWPLEPWTAEVWARAAEKGKILKAHAGEFMPASFVARCINELGVRRIQHGVRCIEDPDVVQLILDTGTSLDVCPISNLKLQVEGIATMADHPIRRLFDLGVHCTINSDDPFMFGNTLSEEYYALEMDLGFSQAELAQIARNGFELADWDSDEKAACIAELDGIMESIR